MGCKKASLSILFTDDKTIHKLNRDWLGRDRPTDVISWSQVEGHAMPGMTGDFKGMFIGDIAISLDTALRQAHGLGHSLDEELNRLLAHGILHLLGHDHVKGGVKAKKMRELEQMLVDKLGDQD